MTTKAIQRRQRVRNAAVFADLATQPILGHRCDDRLLVNIKPDIRDMIPHDPSPYA